MSDVRVEPRPPSFFDLYEEGRALPDEIDDFIDRWHDGTDASAGALPLHEYLGLKFEEYEAWVQDPDILPHILIARRESRPLTEVLTRYLDDLPLAARASDTATVSALRAWLVRRRNR